MHTVTINRCVLSFDGSNHRVDRAEFKKQGGADWSFGLSGLERPLSDCTSDVSTHGHTETLKGRPRGDNTFEILAREAEDGFAFKNLLVNSYKRFNNGTVPAPDWRGPRDLLLKNEQPCGPRRANGRPRSLIEPAGKSRLCRRGKFSGRPHPRPIHDFSTRYFSVTMFKKIGMG
jgi:hypothetical protein